MTKESNNQVYTMCWKEKIFLKKNQNEKVDKIFQYWETTWKNRNEKNDENSIETHFYNLFVENYQYVLSKKEKNKIRNFLWKSIFVIVLLITCVGYMLLFYYFYVNKQIGFMQTIISGGSMVTFNILGCGVVAKWLDINKYQSTWVRHTCLLQQMRYEMLLYSYEMKHYSQFDRETEFILRILKLWNANIDRFIKDMVQNESKLMDIFEGDGVRKKLSKS